jgi:two-component system, sensor histidine kinase ChiS
MMLNHMVKHIIKNNFIIINLFVILLFLLYPHMLSYASENSYSTVIESDKINKLSDDWLFITGDNPDYSKININHDNWKKIKTNENWCDISEYSNYTGNTWYRKIIFIDDISKDYSLYLPVHMGGLEIYFNEILIYRSKISNLKNQLESVIGKNNIIIIPHALITKSNIIALRKGSIDNDASINGFILFGTQKKIERFWILKLIYNGSLAFITFFLTIFFFLIYINRKKELYYLYFSLISLSLSFWIFGFSGIALWFIDKNIIFDIFAYIPSIIVCFSFIKFLKSYFQLKYDLLNKFIDAVLFVLIFSVTIELIITGKKIYFNKYLYNFFILFAFLVVIYGLYLTIRAIFQKKNYSWRIFIGALGLAVAYVVSAIHFLNILPVDPLLIEGFFFMTIIFASVLASRFAQVHTDLEAAHSDLLVLDKMKDDFLATTTHELRTPLHGIIGIAESLTDGSLGEVNARQKENLELISSSATGLNDLVTSILDFSKLRAGKADLYIEEISMGDIITSTVSLIQPSARNKEIEFRTEIGDIPKILADRNRIFQVLLNLLGNAVKFTERGTITVRAVSGDRGRVRVSVSDTGIGIGQEDLARIWNPFTQAEGADRRRSGGTGLGLAIAKNLVELHGGAIWAESEKGRGSVFSFELPSEPVLSGITRRAARPAAHDFSHLSSAPAPDSIEFSITVNPSVAAATILAVDDDPVSLKILENLCVSCNHKLMTTETGPAALDIIAHQDVDLVLLDLMLPGMSGFEVCEKIRQMERGRYIPVIMLTALDQAVHMVQGFRTGANDYITKPFKRHELIQRIENQLAIKQMLDMEKSVINGLRKEKDSITGLFQRSIDIKESAIQMMEWEKIIKEDMSIARAFQQKLMTYQQDIAGFETSVLYRPMLEIGGDIYDIFELRPGVVRVLIADATGHGINASLGTVKILSEYAAVKGTLHTPGEVLNFLNQRFTQVSGQYTIVFTCVVADIDLALSSITMSSAGAPPQFLVRGRETVVVHPRNPIIGLSNKITYREETLAFQRDDILFLYTDGLTEMVAARADVDGEDELLAEAIVSVYPGAGLEDAGERLLSRFAVKKKNAVDDVTIITAKRVG